MVKYDGMPEMVTAEPVAAPRSAAPTERGPRPTEYHWIAVFADGRDPVTSYAPEPYFTLVRDSCHAALRSGLAHFAGTTAIYILDANGYVVATVKPR